MSLICSNTEVKPLKGKTWKHEVNANTKGNGVLCRWLRQRLHILTWIREYDRNKAIADMIAGVTLGMTIIPQSIAYASLAGLSAEYGLYSSFVGSFAYVIFGTIPQASIGPTSLMALLTLQFTMDLPVEFVVMLTFLSGIVEFAFGVFNLGFFVNFISHPVTNAFTSGTSVIVTLVQLKSLLGIKAKSITNDFFNILKQISLGDSILGLTCIGILLGLRQLGSIEFTTDTRSTSKRFWKRFLWYIGISRNAIVVFCSSLLAYYLVHYNGQENVPFALSTKVNITTPSVKLPPFSIIHENATYFFPDTCRKLGGGILVIPIVAVLANVAIAKAFVKESSLDASQEMLTLGICNIAGSFFSAMPTCGAFTRSAVSQASGVRTPLSGVYTGGLVLLALGVLTPYFEYIPKSALSAVLITAVLFMLDFKLVTELWSTSKIDFLNWTGVFLVCILSGVELGLLFGIIINLFFILICLANPKIEVIVKNVNGCNFVHVVPCTDIYFSGVDHLRNKIKSICLECNYLYPVVIECERFTQCDYTSMQVLKSIFKELKEKNVQIYMQFLNCKSKEFVKDFENIGVIFTNEREIEKILINNN